MFPIAPLSAKDKKAFSEGLFGMLGTRSLTDSVACMTARKKGKGPPGKYAVNYAGNVWLGIFSYEERILYPITFQSWSPNSCCYFCAGLRKRHMTFWRNEKPSIDNYS